MRYTKLILIVEKYFKDDKIKYIQYTRNALSILDNNLLYTNINNLYDNPLKPVFRIRYIYYNPNTTNTNCKVYF